MCLIYRERRVHNVSRREFEAMKPHKSPVDSGSNHDQKLDEDLSENEDDLVAVTDEYLQKLEMEDRNPDNSSLNLMNCDEFPDLGSCLRITSS